MQVFISILLLFTIFASVGPFVRTGEWWVRIFDFPRFQLFFIGAVAVAAQMILGIPEPLWLHLSLVGLGAVVTFYQLARVIQFVNHPFKEMDNAVASSGTNEFTALVANVRYKNTDYSRLLDLAAAYSPDWIALLETDEDWQEALAPLRQEYPFKLEEIKPEGCGMSFYSRLPVLSSQIHYLVSSDRPSMQIRLALPDGQRVELYVVHPAPPGLPKEDGELLDSRPRDAELVVVANTVKDSDVPSLTVGDFNDAAWSHTTRLFKKISGLVDPRTGRGFYNTFPAGFWPLQVPIDHVFASSRFKLRKLEVLPSFGSDHLAIFFSLQLSNEAEAREESTDPVEDEYEEELIEQGVAAARGGSS